MNKEKILLAGKIAKQVKDWIKPQIKKGTPLLEIAEKIENKIIELKGKPAFPTNLSINEMTAHYTPSYNDEKKAEGLLKVDLGARVDGWLSDTSFSLDLENSQENKKLIEASEEALKNAIKKIEQDGTIGEIGQEIQETIESKKLLPVLNLGGHNMGEYELHAGINIPNATSEKREKLKKGLYAIEPFATNGSGKVHEGKPSGIYILIETKNIRNPEARKILEFIKEEYHTLPFCSRWLIKKFGTKTLFALRQLEENGNLHQFAQLVESPNSKVSQAEETIFIDDKEIIVTTR